MTDETPPAPKFNADGLIPAIVQHAETGQVLMMAYMNAESLARTRESGDVWFWSRSRQELWHKGATSGHYLRVQGLRLDCDGDVVLIEARPEGPTCHTGRPSCFHFRIEPDGSIEPLEADLPPQPLSLKGGGSRELPLPRGEGRGEGSSEPRAEASQTAGAGVLDEVFALIQERQRTRPEGSYVNYLLTQGIDKIGKKVGEEAAETIIAAKNAAPDQIAAEVADLWFHTLVLLAASGMSPAAVYDELAKRRK